MVSFDRTTINALYEMPNCENYGYQSMMGGTVPYDEILQRLCVPRAAWKLNLEGEVVNFESKYLVSTPYNWFLFIASRIMPSNHM